METGLSHWSEVRIPSLPFTYHLKPEVRPSHLNQLSNKSFNRNPIQWLSQSRYRFEPSLILQASGGSGFQWVRGGTEDLKWIINYRLGAQLIYNLSENFGIRSGIDFLQKGYRVDYEITDISTTKYRNNLNYLSIPVLAHFYTDKRMRWFFNIGPEISYFINGTQKGESKTPEDLLPIDYKISDGINSFDISLSVGGGILIPLKTIKGGPSYHLLVDVLYSRSYLPIHEKEGDATNVEFLHTGIQMNVGFAMKL